MRRAFAAVRATRPGVAPWVLPAMLLLWSSSVRAQELYGCDSAAQLFRVDPVTGAGTHLCDLPTYPDPGATEIEYDEVSGSSFVQARDGFFGGRMFNIFSCAGTGTLVPTGDLVFNGLEFIGGVLYGTAIPNQCQPSLLAILDPVTGVPAAIGPTGEGPIAGLAWNKETQTLYGITGCAQQLGPSRLVIVDLATGVATTVGSTGRSLGSLEFGPYMLLYAGGDSRDGGNLYTIDPATGASTLIGPTGFASVTGLTLAARPLPVLISDFDATPFEGGVRLAWEIFSDEQVVGFRIYRSLAGTGNAESIAGDGLIPSHARAYTDEGVRAGETYDYTLGVILTDREVMSPVATARTGAYTPALHQNTPNPFNPSTTISFTLAQRAGTTLSIYDVNGRRVATLVDGIVGAGFHEYLWNGKNARGDTMRSGVYFYRLTSGKHTFTRKMVRLR